MERLADERNKRINEAGEFLTALYWDLGALLLRLKTICGKHGTWEKKLFRLHIDRTRATKAMAIKNTFNERADCEQMSVEKAYAMRTRKKTVEYVEPKPPNNSCFSPTANIHVYNCRLQDLEGLGGVKPETVGLLKTDPPYLGEWLPELPDLAAFTGACCDPAA